MAPLSLNVNNVQLGFSFSPWLYILLCLDSSYLGVCLVIGSTSSGLYSITYLYISNHFIDLINRDLIVIAFVDCVKKSRELSAVCLDAIIGENKYWWEDAIGGHHD